MQRVLARHISAKIARRTITDVKLGGNVLLPAASENRTWLHARSCRGYERANGPEPKE
jgi:hypothetical protein